MNKTTKTAILALSALLLWMLTGIFQKSSNLNDINSLKINTEEKVIKVKAKKIKSELRQSNVLVQGRTESNRNVLVSSETNGIVKEIFVKKGIKEQFKRCCSFINS